MKSINLILLGGIALIGSAESSIESAESDVNKGEISYTTLSKFFNITFSDEDLREGIYTDKDGDFKIPSGVTTVNIKPSGHFENVIIPDTVKSINPDFFKNCEVEKVVINAKTAKSILKGNYGENPAENLGTYFSLMGTEIIIEDLLKDFNKDQLRKVEETQLDKKDPFLSEIQNFNKGKLRKATVQKKATQTEKSLQEQLNSQKSKLKETETQKRNPKEYYVSPLHKEIQDFDHLKLKRVEKTDKSDKIEKPNPDIFASNPVVNEASKDPFLNNNNQNPTEVERPKSPFLNDINNFNSKNLNHVDQQKIRKRETPHPHANFLANRRKAMGEDEDLDENRSTEQIQEEDDYNNWDD